jgi:Bacterial regulatory protein, Fis family
MIDETLRETHGNKQQAAQILGLSRQGLIKMLKRLGVRFSLTPRLSAAISLGNKYSRPTLPKLTRISWLPRFLIALTKIP